jgi:flotillin
MRQQARIDVAEASRLGNVGSELRRGQQEREIAKIHADTAVQKTERDIERAEAEAKLATRKTAFDRDVDIARIEASRATESKDEDLKREVEIKRAAAEMERLRATDVVKAAIVRESKQQAADAKAYEIEAQAKAAFEQSKQTTDAAAYKTRLDAQAWSDAAIKNAEANLQKKLKEAEGLAAMAGAYSKLSEAFGGPAGLLQVSRETSGGWLSKGGRFFLLTCCCQYMMIEKGTYVELAKANASAIQGLQPKISVWNTGAQAGSGGGAHDGSQSQVDTMRNIYQMLPPLMSTINDQTGITLPEWQFGRLAGEMSQVERGGKVQNGK